MIRHTLITALLGLSVVAAAPAGAADVKEVYKFYCAQCHGLNGKGDGPNVTKDFSTDPRNFTSAKEMVKLSDADLKNVILDGGPSVSKSELMPPWGKTLAAIDVDALVKYLRELCQCVGKK